MLTGARLSVGLAIGLMVGCEDDSGPGAALPDPTQVLKSAHVREIRDALTRAIDCFDQRNFDSSIAYCHWILQREPEYTVAQELAEDSEKVKTREEYYDFLRAKVENWRRLCGDEEDSLIPYQDSLTYPHLGLPRASVAVFPEAPASIGCSKMD